MGENAGNKCVKLFLNPHDKCNTKEVKRKKTE
jgi:hypothetical protein